MPLQRFLDYQGLGTSGAVPPLMPFLYISVLQVFVSEYLFNLQQPDTRHSYFLKIFTDVNERWTTEMKYSPASVYCSKPSKLLSKTDLFLPEVFICSASPSSFSSSVPMTTTGRNPEIFNFDFPLFPLDFLKFHILFLSEI